MATGLLAGCGHVARYREDVALMREMAINSDRFSVAGPCAMVGEEGRGFSDRLVDALPVAGVEPFRRPFTWIFPATRTWVGGWPNPDSLGWFSDLPYRSCGASPIERGLGSR